MNNGSAWSVRLLVLAALIFGSACGRLLAQKDDPSLTKDFPKLSPKERSRIAAKETAEAEQDEAYQGVMREAERAFQEGRYEEALASYEKARTLRPYNVYPKVKIQDLQALLKRKAEEARTDTTDAIKAKGTTPPPADALRVKATPVQEKPSTVSPSTPGGTPAQRPLPTGNTSKEVPATRPADRPVRRAEPTPPTQARPAPPQGMEERRYQEGHAFVIERTINVEGRRVVYKRVAHPFGQVFYFEDGVAVDERVWNARFQGQ